MTQHHYYAEGRPGVIFYDVIENLYRPIAQEIAFYQQHIPENGASILELGCGTGRITWPMAAANYHMFGVDIAPACIDRAVKKKADFLPEIAERAHFMLADACVLQLPEQYSYILAPYRVFDHIATEEGQQAFLARVKHHLAADGLFIFDTNLPTERLLYRPEEVRMQPPLVVELPALQITVSRYIVDIAHEIPSRRLTVDFGYRITLKTGETFTHVDRLAVRWSTPEHIRSMLVKHGFKVEAEYGDFAHSAPINTSEDRVWLVRG